MENIILSGLVRFYPYQSVHASQRCIKIESNSNWYNTISKFLSNYEPDEFFNCPKNYFPLTIDNKITLELSMDMLHEKAIFVTYWDGSIYISTSYHTISDKNSIYCTVKKKS